MNLLANETSPYLRQHQDNPVHWMPWGPAALDKAKAENKPILLSIGYAACHWCHVMAHESFEDGDTAALMNQHFVNIKVDREERPDIDMIFQNALALLGQHGGWPLTMFLTPRGEPFWGGTYFPPQARHGLPGFREVLRGVHESYLQEHDKIDYNVKSLTDALHRMQDREPGTLVTRDQLDRIGAYFLSITDSANGGIGEAPKFPSLTITSLMWDCYLRTGGGPYKAAVIHALSQMSQGGIYDHIGGGYCRYSVDNEWLVPHFEKMLYDNALFVGLLSEVWKETQHPLFEARIRETAGWLLRDMAVEHGGHAAFASSYDADSRDSAGHMEEGAYYVWKAEDVDAALGNESDFFKQVYDITAFGNWESVNIPNRLKKPGLLSPSEEIKLALLRGKLKEIRDRRIPPGRDGKVLADWNGLMITALVRASFALDEPLYLKAAQSAFSFVTENMMESGGLLRHVFCDGKTAHPATLEDYANMAEAALALHGATGDGRYLAQAKEWADVLLRDYWDAGGKGFFMSLAHDGLLLRPKSGDDTATPSGNGTILGVLSQLYLITGKQLYADRAEETACAFSADILQHFFPLATLLSASDFMSHPVTAVLAGHKGREEFLNELRKISFPRLVVLEAGDGVHSGHPAAGKIAAGDRTTAYICPYRACLPPITEPEKFARALREERTRGRQGAANDG
ncbi:MAG: thioredoxin domain-containing protein [Alphaproteobacteria bacterium]|nr:MAG: thioredoxin domain-containing protein [Alphaproteobacteria bacterium]